MVWEKELILPKPTATPKNAVSLVALTAARPDDKLTGSPTKMSAPSATPIERIAPYQGAPDIVLTGRKPFGRSTFTIKNYLLFKAPRVLLTEFNLTIVAIFSAFIWISLTTE